MGTNFAPDWSRKSQEEFGMIFPGLEVDAIPVLIHGRVAQ
jgi:hypothetical protein